jgi:hypothetical protein
VDPLGYADSPNLYQYGLNSPTIYRDSLGLKVKVLDNSALDIIRKTVPKSLAGEIRLGVDGFIDKDRIEAIQSGDQNLLDLLRLVRSKHTVEVSTAPSFSCMEDGKLQHVEFKYESVDDIVSSLVDLIGKDDAERLRKEIVADNFLGVTLPPKSPFNDFDEDKCRGIGDNVAVTVGNLPNAPEHEVVITMAHELYGHALLYVQNKEWQHPEVGTNEVNRNIEIIERRTRELLGVIMP